MNRSSIIGALRRSAILTFHSLDDSGSVISLAPRVFREQMRWLASSGVPVVPLDEITRRPGAIALTFDDGFRNFAVHAAPLLMELKLPATVFAVSGYAGGTNNWPSQPAAIPRLPLLDWSELRDLDRAGFAIGNHTVTHPDLTSLDDAAAAREVVDARVEIEQRIGAPAPWFAYPYGRVARVAAAAAHSVALGTRLAYLGAANDPLNLPRLDVYYFRSPAMFRQIPSRTGTLWTLVRALPRKLGGFHLS